MDISGEEVLTSNSTIWMSLPLSETEYVSSVRIAVVISSEVEAGADVLEDVGSGVSVTISVVVVEST